MKNDLVQLTCDYRDLSEKEIRYFNTLLLEVFLDHLDELNQMR